MKHEPNPKIVISFLDESASFTNGYECGTISQKMEYGQAIYSVVHVVNQKQLEMIAERHNYNAKFHLMDLAEEWIHMDALPKDVVVTQAPHT